MGQMLRLRLRWSRICAGGLGLFCLVAVGAAVGASNTSTVPDQSAAAIAITRDGSSVHVTISCRGSNHLACARLTQLRKKPFERCLQVWGGPERAVIHLPQVRPIVVTRANSCGIARWAELQKQLR